ncbi:MAG TPA: flagellar biosynthesis protein FlhF [Gammaproteobacteria bacterium]|nr:flagellar biosynthesis protein FlhF [Gammaproteobacteria bacterium]
MNIRRYVANDMREALASIRTDLGPDAVMLSSRKLPNGVEVIAAVDYDDSLLGNAAAAATAQADGASTAQLDEYEQVARRLAGVDNVAPVAAATPAPAPAPIPAPVAAPVADATADTSVALEIKDLRRLLETQLASLAWSDLNRQAPVRARLLRELAKLGVDSTLAAELADEVPAEVNYQEAMRLVVRRFGERLPLVSWDMAEGGGVFAIVGPTGVGKTTSLAKIAARFVLRHSVEQLGLVSTDTYRIGARQQLNNFARILRAPMQVAENAADLRRVLDGFANKKLVLIDTAGMSQRDVRLANQFTTLKVEGHSVRTVLALSAGADRGCLAEAAKVFKAANPEALIVTKLDEAATLGGVLSLSISSSLPVAYLSDGQRVPEDLHRAAPKRFWLLHNALKLSANGATAPDEHELADRFGHMELAANA